MPPQASPPQDSLSPIGGRMPSQYLRYSAALRKISTPTSKRALFLRIAAVLLAVITAIDVASTMNQLRRRSNALGTSYSVEVARHDLPAGHKIMNSDLRSVRLHSPPPHPALLRRAVGGRIAIPVLKGNVVTTRHLGVLTNLLPQGMRGIRVVSSDARQLRARDVVDVFVTLDPDRFSGGEPTREVISGVSVIRIERTADGTAATLAVPLELVPRIAFAIASGVVTLASVPASDSP